jgi:hypothetical protein
MALGLCNSVLADLIQQSLIADFQKRRRLFAVPVGFVQSFSDGFVFVFGFAGEWGLQCG